MATDLPRVVTLDDPHATSVALAGGKAAALARASAAGLPALPGSVLTTAFSDDIDAGAAVSTHRALREAFELMDGADRPLVARSSSVVEDAAASSMAGQFESVIGIEGFDEFGTAVTKVLDSRQRAGATESPIAVLVQPLIAPRLGGIMFGVDPVSGRSDRRVIAAIAGAPEPLVSGEVDGSRYVVDTAGRVIDTDLSDGPTLDRNLLRDLAALGDRLTDLFGGPQDVEWAVEGDRTIALLQSRPVTTEIRGVPAGPIFSPGPVAETFPEPLTELEADLWVPPLRTGLREATLLAGTARHSDFDNTEIVTVINGWVAIDLQLAGEIPPPSGWWRRLNPIPAVRQLRGAWRIGRLRAALPGLAQDLLDRVDADLESVPATTELTSRQLTSLLARGRDVLAALHGYEILMGLLSRTTGNRLTGASVALRILAEARIDGLDDTEIIARSPTVLALTAPAITDVTELPQQVEATTLPQPEGQASDDAGIIREALRLRVRWTQELTSRAAWTLGERLTEAGQLETAEAVRHLDLETLHALVSGRAVTVPVSLAEHHHDPPDPLPACFQISDLGRPIVVKRANETGGGTGAGGGVSVGIVTRDAENPPEGAVLVTTTLRPGLAPLLPDLAGIVSETGSVLSHLAILGRESGVATIVGYANALDDLPEGATVEVNGENGDVTILQEESR